MILDTIITIIPTACCIITCILALKTIKISKEVEELLKSNEKENLKDVNVDDILYSMEFNTALDGQIQPLLGKYSNDQIVKIVLDRMYGSKIYDQIPEPMLSEHIRETLRNYQNSYNKEILEKFVDRDDSLDAFRYNMMAKAHGHIKDQDIDEIVEDNKTNNTDFNLTGVLNNFYKD